MTTDPIILAIDTSCDETAAAVTMGRRILSNVISSQVDIHTKYGGVYPALAKRAHIERIDGVVSEALKRATTRYRNIGNADTDAEKGLTLSYPVDRVRPCQPTNFPNQQINQSTCLPAGKACQLPFSAVAVTQGPGLAIALEVGIAKAKALAINSNIEARNPKQTQNINIPNSKLNENDYIDSRIHGNDKEKPQMTTSDNLVTTYDGLPLIAINHLEGHILSTIAQNSMGNPKREILFPALALIVSGGNTQMLIMREIGKYELIGETLDDACGEALDKAARILQLGYPGGPIIERLALTGNPEKYVLKPTLTAKNNLNFSYSGLKTAFIYLVQKLPEKEFGINLNNLAAAFQYWAFEQIIRKLTQAIKVYCPRSVLCGGGVLANKRLRYLLHRSTSIIKVPTYFPINKLLYGDNAAMIGMAAYYKFMRNEFIKPEELDRRPRFPLCVN